MFVNNLIHFVFYFKRDANLIDTGLVALTNWIHFPRITLQYAFPLTRD